MEPVTAKLITLASLLVLTLFFSTLPFFLVLRRSRALVSSRRRDSVIAYLNCLGGGVFLGTLLLFIFTEGGEEMNKYLEEANVAGEYPVFNVCVALGFFLVAFVEYIMHSCLHHAHRHGHQHSHHDHQHEDLEYSGTNHGSVGEVIQPQHSNDICNISPRSGNYGAVSFRHVDGVAVGGHAETQHLLGKSPSDIPGEVMVKSPSLCHDMGHGVIGTPSRSTHKHNANHTTITNPAGTVADAPTGVRAFLLLLALSFHTIFDGLAVGLQENASQVWSVFAAVTIHKSVIAFCLGVELFQSHVDRPFRAFLWLCFFALMSPIGIGIGIGLTSGGINELAKLLASGILQGLSGGAFLYVTFLEILCLHIGHHCQGNFFYIFTALIGFVCMAVIKFLDS